MPLVITRWVASEYRIIVNPHGAFILQHKNTHNHGFAFMSVNATLHQAQEAAAQAHAEGRRA